jgi:hypothetical protein
MIFKFDGIMSHIPILDYAFSIIDPKEVLEFGTGDFSTKYFVERGCVLTSIESQSEEWFHKAQSINPNSIYLPDPKIVLNYAERLKKKWDLIFIDNDLESRWQLIDRLQKNTDTIISHDSEQSQYNFHSCSLEPGWVMFDMVLFRPWSIVVTKNEKIIEGFKKKWPCWFYDTPADKNYLSRKGERAL